MSPLGLQPAFSSQAGDAQLEGLLKVQWWEFGVSLVGVWEFGVGGLAVTDFGQTDIHKEQVLFKKNKAEQKAKKNKQEDTDSGGTNNMVRVFC